MNLLILIFFGSLLVNSIGQSVISDELTARVVHGPGSKNPVPFVVSVLAEDSYTEVWTRFCVGSIINQYSVLVTAKCAGFCRNPSLCKVIVGSLVISGQNVPVIGSVFHSSYTPLAFHSSPFDVLGSYNVFL